MVTPVSLTRKSKTLITERIQVFVTRISGISSSFAGQAKSDGREDQEGKAEAGGDDRHHHEGDDSRKVER